VIRTVVHSCSCLRRVEQVELVEQVEREEQVERVERVDPVQLVERGEAEVAADPDPVGGSGQGHRIQISCTN